MWKRLILALVAASAMVAGSWAQENATIVLRSGEKLSGQLIDMGGSGFTVKVGGQDRQIPTGDVAVIDFGGSGEVSDAEWDRVKGGGQIIRLRNGETIDGQLFDVGGTAPLRLTIKTPSGERELKSSEVSRIVMARPSGGAAGTSGSSRTPDIPAGAGIAVSGTQAWTPTGIVVRKGDRLAIEATGEVRLSTDSADVASPTGSRAGKTSPNSPLAQVPTGALIARVGDGGEPFPLGDRLTVSMPANGQLFLGINDDHLGDNAGGFRVQIRRESRR